jgi:Glycosyltransferase like family 2
MFLLAALKWCGIGLAWSDVGVAHCLVPLAWIILASGLDDLVLDAVCLWAWLARRLPARAEGYSEGGSRHEKTIAIFVPLWHEHRVIAGMVEHNTAAIHYQNYHFFIGAYPNDDPTLDAVRDLESRFPNVHLAVCPHNDRSLSEAARRRMLSKGVLVGTGALRTES